MARKKPVYAHGIVAASKYADLDKAIIAALCNTIDRIGRVDPVIYDHLRLELGILEKLLDAEEPTDGRGHAP
jgi:hypothetical protein